MNYNKIAENLKTIAHETRLQIFTLLYYSQGVQFTLAGCGERFAGFPVTELRDQYGNATGKKAKQAQFSQYLATLRQANIVNTARKNGFTFYSYNDENPANEYLKHFTEGWCAEDIKSIASGSRLQVLHAILKKYPIACKNLALECNVTQADVSQAIRRMRQILCLSKVEKQMKFYGIKKQYRSTIEQMFNVVVEK